ncbi:MAG: protein-disulfide reductase DsbD domain-containing protein [Pseudomonadota bacterium]
MRSLVHLLVAAAAFCGTAAPIAGPTAAQILTPIDQMEPASLRLTDGWREEDGSRIVALVFDLQPGWKTYWRAPGELGIPPQFDWSGSQNLAQADPLWPVPDIYEAMGMRYPAFADRLVLPVRLRAQNPALPVTVRMNAFFGVCEDVCMPAEAYVEAALPPDSGQGVEAALIQTALADRPLDAETGGLASVECALRPDGYVVELTATMTFYAAFAAEIVMIEAPIEDLWISDPVVRQDGSRVTATTRLDYFGEGPLVLDRDRLRFTVIGPDGAVEVSGCPSG